MYVEGYRRDGSTYVPEYIEEISAEKCLGCGRCFKVCSHDVYDLIERQDLDLDDDDDDIGGKVMSIKASGNCIGCKACGKVCTRKCLTFAPLAA